MDRPPLRALTGIRFLAAIHVVVYHYAPVLPAPAKLFAANGYLAVGLFFVLSGFVLSYNYAERPMDTRRFLAARLARIYPAYLLGLVLVGPAVVLRLHGDPAKLAAAGLAAGALIQAWLPKLALVWNGPGWSLSNEAFFYLLFPAILPLLTRLSCRGLWVAGGVCWAASLTPPLVMMAFGGEAAAVTYIPVFRLAEFVMGAAAGVAYLRGDANWGRAAGVIALAVVVFGTLSSLWAAPVLRGPLAAPLFAALVVSLAPGHGIAARLLSLRPAQILGEASYAIYILQSPVMAWFLLVTQGVLAAGRRAPLGWLSFASYLAILVAASMACHRWIETPARRWLQSRGRRSTLRCKIEINRYDPPDSAVSDRRGLRGAPTEI